jgi:hypothetical protein
MLLKNVEVVETEKVDSFKPRKLTYNRKKSH